MANFLWLLIVVGKQYGNLIIVLLLSIAEMPFYNSLSFIVQACNAES